MKTFSSNRTFSWKQKEISLTLWCSVAVLLSTLLFYFPIPRSLHRLSVGLLCAGPLLILDYSQSRRLLLENRLALIAGCVLIYFSTSILWTSELSLKTICKSLATFTMSIAMLLAALWSIRTQESLMKGIQWFLPLAILGTLGSLSLFYVYYSFPVTRFQHYYDQGTGPARTSWIMGFATVLSASYFLHPATRSKVWNTIALVGFILFFLATLYTHTRSTVLCLFGTVPLLFVHIKECLAKAMILLAVGTTIVAIYMASLHTSPHENREAVTTHNVLFLKRVEDTGHARPAGILHTNLANAYARISAWEELLSSMSIRDCIVGKGLYAKYNFSFYIEHPHSGYIWALYHGGLLGLVLILYLLIYAFRAAVRMGERGYIPGSLLFFGCLVYLMDGQFFVGTFQYEWLLAWIPLALLTGLSHRLTPRVDCLESL